jgi:hypothetical protein
MAAAKFDSMARAFNASGGMTLTELEGNVGF